MAWSICHSYEIQTSQKETFINLTNELVDGWMNGWIDGKIRTGNDIREQNLFKFTRG